MGCWTATRVYCATGRPAPRPVLKTGATTATTEVGEPLRSIALDAHPAGQEVHPYALVANAGLWEGSRRAKPPARMRLGSAPKFVMENQQYMSRARDGTTWLDWEIGESPLGYDIGYMGLAHPEVREYERSAFVSFARDSARTACRWNMSRCLPRATRCGRWATTRLL